MYKRILVAVENVSVRSSAAINKAAALAQASGAELELFHGLAGPVFIEELAPGQRSLAAARSAGVASALRGLEKLAKPLRQKGATVRTAAVWDYPAHEAIVRHAISTGADLVVIDPKHRHRMATLMGYNDWELLRECPTALLVIKSKRPWRNPTVLAAVDPAHAYAKPAGLDGKIIERALELGKILGGKVHAVHAFQAMPIILQAATMEDSRLATIAITDAQRDAGAKMQEELADSGIPQRQQHLLRAHPVDAIRQTARKLRCGVLVMGSISRSGIKRLFIGNTAERILDEVGCDILVVRPTGFKNRVAARVRGLQLLSAAALSQQPMF